MRRRRLGRLSESVTLYTSLRPSRGVYAVLAIVVLAVALVSAIYSLDFVRSAKEHDFVLSLPVLVLFLLQAMTILLAISLVRSLIECNRRLRILREDPDANVRPMPVSFLESVLLRF